MYLLNQNIYLVISLNRQHAKKKNLTPTCKVKGTLEAELQLAETAEFNSWSVFIKLQHENQ